MKFIALWMSLFIIGVFIFQVIIPGFTDVFVLNQLSYSQPWRLITAIFLHGSLTHLVFNLFALLLFGLILEKFIGWKNFLAIFFVSGILANLFSVNFYSSSLGASGAIMGVIGALTVIRPGMPVWAFSVPMPLIIASFLWTIGDVLGAFGYGQGGIGNFAHLSGLAIGLIFGIYFKSKIRRKKKMPRVEIPEQGIRLWEDRYLLKNT
ncbi:MAG: rhomboid family intramembrane serine protease [archaeon]